MSSSNRSAVAAANALISLAAAEFHAVQAEWENLNQELVRACADWANARSRLGQLRTAAPWGVCVDIPNLHASVESWLCRQMSENRTRMMSAISSMHQLIGRAEGMAAKLEAQRNQFVYASLKEGDSAHTSAAGTQQDPEAVLASEGSLSYRLPLSCVRRVLEFQTRLIGMLEEELTSKLEIVHAVLAPDHAGLLEELSGVAGGLDRVTGTSNSSASQACSTTSAQEVSTQNPVTDPSGMVRPFIGHTDGASNAGNLGSAALLTGDPIPAESAGGQDGINTLPNSDQLNLYITALQLEPALLTRELQHYQNQITHMLSTQLSLELL